MNTRIPISLAIVTTVATLAAAPAVAQNDARPDVGARADTEVGAHEDETFRGSVKDAWLTGKIETVFTLNRHLNPFAIDTDVENGVVSLTGTVENDIDRDLAAELAKGVDGVVEVRNELLVDADPEIDDADETERLASDAEGDDATAPDRDFGTWVDDATTTAAVKSRLVGNDNVGALGIDVDTYEDVVTLTGRVTSDEESNLAEEIARNTRDVSDVHNELVVDPSH
jgi:osmotically-inducible protein OsmY